ncbi:MAG: NAD kinase [Flavobacteriales bacterium]|nr:NAD kinase [Flavobacteriales bacterium]
MNKDIKRVGLYGVKIHPESEPFVKVLITILESKGVELLVFESIYNDLASKKLLNTEPSRFSTYEDLKGNIDILFSLGGDGTMLESIMLIRDSGIPVMGINTGRLGFLSSIAKEEIEWALNELFAGHYFLAKRSLLRMETEEALFGNLNFAMNELTLHKKDTSSMISIHTWIDDEFLNTFWADGLIIATPTGSTGYSLSCGGPIVHPTTGNFVITPIAPHNLTVRPMIISDQSVIRLKVEGRSDSFLATLDSRSITIDSSLEMIVRKESFYVPFVRLTGQSFLTTLRNKLMWGMDKRN